MSLCSDCIKGVRHEGKPEGKYEFIGGVRSYVETPTVDYPKDKAILFLTDAFGIDLINTQLLVDDFARNRFKVVAMDLFNNDAVPVEVFETGQFDVAAWFSIHMPDATRPAVDKVVAALKEQGITEFAAVGYCYGARHVFNLAFDKVIKVSAVAHPSGLKFPEDLHKYKETKIPLLINSCTIDQQFPLEEHERVDAILGGGSTNTDTYRREYFEGCVHGFAVRGDMSKPEVKAGKEGAFKATVEFFLKHLYVFQTR